MKLTINQKIKKALTLHKERKFEEAEKFYREILKSHPTHPDANHNLGIIEFSKNKFTTAQSLFKTAVKSNSKIEQFWISYINVFIKQNKFEEAEIYSKKAIDFEVKFATVHFNLGAIMQVLNRLDEAEVSYRKAIEIKPKYAEAYNNLSLTLKDLGKVKEAEANCKKALDLKPNFAEGLNNFGIILKKLNKLEDAEVNCRKAVNLKPNFAEAHNNLGSILQQLNRPDEAEKNYKKALLLKPNYVTAHYNLGTMLIDLGRFKEAEINFKKAVELKPRFFEAISNLGIIYENLGRLDEAEVSYKKAIEINPNFKQALLNIGRILFEKGEAQLSLKYFDLCNTEESRARALVSLYALGQIDKIYQRIETCAKLDDENIRVATFSTFIAEKEKKETAHNFCKNPIDFIKVSNLSSHIKNPKLFTAEVIKELYSIKSIWEPPSRTTRNGFHSGNKFNIFKKPSKKISRLKSIIINELDSYNLKFKKESCSYIKKWPYKKDLTGWYVILKQQGYQLTHTHPSGWLSGVIYLKVVPSLENNEGAIEFSLSGGYYSDVNSKKLIHEPKVGDIILFPSSLHHRTIPFTTNTDRIIISFDLIPNQK